MKISETNRSELKKLVEIYNHYVRSTTVTFNTEELDVSRFLEAFYADEERYTLHTIIDGGSIVGFCSMNPFNKKEAYRRSAYVSIYLDSGVTGKGVGSSALAFLEDLAVKKGVRSLIALISKENGASCSFFEKHGYTKAGELREAGEKFGRLLDVVYYQKLLKDS